MIAHDIVALKPYSYMWCDERGVRYEIHLIALTLNSNVVKMTDYHTYIGDKTKIRKHSKQNLDDVRRVCNCLNYILFKYFWKYQAKSITEIPFEAVQDYITEYANSKTQFSEYPSRQSIEKERRVISFFMMNLAKFLRDGKIHYYVRKRIYRDSSSKVRNVRGKSYESHFWEYEIQAKYKGEHKYELVRDIPQNAIPVILKWIQLKAPDLYFAVILQLSAGLREGEVVNLRRVDSIYPGGIRYTKENGKFTSFEVDLTEEYLLRSDGKKVGHIKNKRIQSVYPVFLPIVQNAFEMHMKTISEFDLELMKPLFVTSRFNNETGKRIALTKQAYCNRVISIVKKYALPEMLVSNDTELKVFALKMNEGNWGLHAFRHWFTVQLALNDEDANSIAFFRGDTSTETAFIYLQNKGILQRKYVKVTNMVSNDIIQVISKMENVYE